MIRRFSTLAAVAIVVGALACAGSEATAPSRFGARASLDRSGPPGSVGAPRIIANGQGGLLGCTPRDAQYGTAAIGPSGGELDVGPNRLIIPPGALTETVQISGTTPDDGTPAIFFEPHGLQFNKSAGLIMDVTNCLDVPPVIYINEIGVLSDPIPAVYSTWWHTVAAPIDHFSGYLVGF
jgi:hypothetical protein